MYNIYFHIRYELKQLKSRFQRFFRGYATFDVFEMNRWLVHTMEPMLKYLREHHGTCPYKYTDREWIERLDKMSAILRGINEAWEFFDYGYGTTEDAIIVSADLDRDIKEFFEMLSEDFRYMIDDEYLAK